MYGNLDDAIANSKFWTYSNKEEDSDIENIKGEWHEQTPAAQILGFAVEEFLEKMGIKIIIAVISTDVDANQKMTLPVTSNHPLYPDKLIVGGQQGLTSRGRFIMYLFMVPVDDSFNPEDVNPKIISNKVGNIVRHEIIHAIQFEKRSKGQKISRVLAKSKFEDEGEIPDSENRDDYLGSKMEIDAYAHEFAEELLQKYGKEKSLNILRGSTPLDTLDMSDQFIEYFQDISNTDITNRLKNKIYSHIINLTDREIYSETKSKKKRKKKKKYSGSQPEDTYKKATVKNMYMDKDSSHGGWPDGPSKSFTSKEPVMKQISSWMKSMKILD
jgi:hypothetical protein